MARDTTVQFRMDSTIKEEAFAVFKEMGISPSEAVRVFFKQVQKTRTLPFIVAADHDIASEAEAGYAGWLKARLANTIRQLDRGEMKSYPSGEAKALLSARMAVRRRKQSSAAK